ncbi:MAG: GlsB/YeaQ/YmgE family stress response membrane protein [Chthoniobacterales bacterium]|nr:GlsB/YeaQ/YmgE family stress response membrane protein [Chthoniobacterales bacterium]
MLHIIWSIIIGFVIGLLARAIMPGAQHLGLIMTTVVGVVGSLAGGLIARMFSKPQPGTPFHPAGLLMSVVGALIVLFLMGRFYQG